MQFFNHNLLDDYVESYKLQIQIIELYKSSNEIEQKFLYCIAQNTFKLINLIENQVRIQKKYNESFILLKVELEHCLKNSSKIKTNTNTYNIYEKFQTLLGNIEENLKLV